MPSNKGLKVCTFNAKYDPIDYNCCAKQSCGSGCDKKSKSTGHHDRVPDSLLAAMIAVKILPSNADVYNIQNVNRCAVDHLLKEVARVSDIMRKFNLCLKCDGTSQQPMDSIDTDLMNLAKQVACELNQFSGLCDDALSLKDALECCGVCDLDYYTEKKSECSSAVVDSVRRYSNTEEYNAYHNGSCLTLVKKSLGVVPETMTVPCVDSIVMFYEHSGQRFINVNVNLGEMVDSFEDVAMKRAQAGQIIDFLNKYKECGAVVMNGAFGDIDYDTPQLLFRGDASLPEYAQKALASGVRPNPVPSDFPCDLSNPLFNILEFLLKNCKAEHIPYSWLLQYIRLKNCQKDKLYKLVPSCNKNSGKCVKTCCLKDVDNSSYVDRKKVTDVTDHRGHSGKNRAQMRQNKDRADRCRTQTQNNYVNNADTDVHETKQTGCGCPTSRYSTKCDTPACTPAPSCSNCTTSCDAKCDDKCGVKSKQCNCSKAPYTIKCNDTTDCKCDSSKHRVHVDVCKDLCKTKKECEDNKVVCGDDCADFKYCDTLSVLKRDLCLFNVLNKIPNVNDRYTGYHNHFNKALDCKFPRGVFQAWATCEDYSHPCDGSRVVENNSELMALDHFLVSDCLKNNVSNACLSKICIEKCGTDVHGLINDGLYNALYEVPHGGINGPMTGSTCANNGNAAGYVMQYTGSAVKSFFTHRVYCAVFNFPHRTKGCVVENNETLHGLGLNGLWSAICTPGSDCIDISVLKTFGLDRHDFFRNFFWNPLKSHSFNVGSSSLSVSSLIAPPQLLSGCASDSTIWIQRRSSICEEEFYKHMLCVLSNSDTRDGFIVTVSLMEALYKTEKMRSYLSELHRLILDNASGVTDLFTLLSQCFKEQYDVAVYADSYESIGSGTQTYTAQSALLQSIDQIQVSRVLNVLSFQLMNNCNFVDVVIRNLAKRGGASCDGVQQDDSTDCGITCMSDIDDILKTSGCGQDVTYALLESLKNNSDKGSVFYQVFLETSGIPPLCITPPLDYEPL